MWRGILSLLGFISPLFMLQKGFSNLMSPHTALFTAFLFMLSIVWLCFYLVRRKDAKNTPLSIFEAVILSALEHEKGSLTQTNLIILLQENSIKLTQQELYDYAEDLEGKGLVRLIFTGAPCDRELLGLYITGEGRTALHAIHYFQNISRYVSHEETKGSEQKTRY